MNNIKFKVTVLETGDVLFGKITSIFLLNEPPYVNYYLEYELFNKSRDPYHFFGFEFDSSTTDIASRFARFNDFKNTIGQYTGKADLQDIKNYYLRPNEYIAGKTIIQTQKGEKQEEKVPILICKIGGYETKTEMIN